MFMLPFAGLVKLTFPGCAAISIPTTMTPPLRATMFKATYTAFPNFSRLITDHSTFCVDVVCDQQLTLDEPPQPAYFVKAASCRSKDLSLKH